MVCHSLNLFGLLWLLGHHCLFFWRIPVMVVCSWSAEALIWIITLPLPMTRHWMNLTIVTLLWIKFCHSIKTIFGFLVLSDHLILSNHRMLPDYRMLSDHRIFKNRFNWMFSLFPTSSTLSRAKKYPIWSFAVHIEGSPPPSQMMQNPCISWVRPYFTGSPTAKFHESSPVCTGDEPSLDFCDMQPRTSNCQCTMRKL